MSTGNTQAYQWDDLRVFLAIARSGNTSRAARILNVNQSTVSRRLQALEDALQLVLFSRTATGLTLSADGERLLRLALKVEEAALAIDRELTGTRDALEGVVRVTTVEEIASMIIAPNLKSFRERWPRIQLKLITSNRNLDLSRGEADVALRMARPTQGDLVARKVGGFGYGVFTTQAYLDGLESERVGKPELLDWVVLDPGVVPWPDALWFDREMPGVVPVLRATSFKTLLASVQAGLGVALLPRPYRYMYPELVLLPIATGPLHNEIWLTVHKDLRKVKAIEAVMTFLEETMRKPLK